MSRNSAKSPRKFARRGASEKKKKKKGPGNCLPKTQVSAKSKDEV